MTTPELELENEELRRLLQRTQAGSEPGKEKTA